MRNGNERQHDGTTIQSTGKKTALLRQERDQLRADRAALLEQLRLLVGHLDDDLPFNLARVREFITEMESRP